MKSNQVSASTLVDLLASRSAEEPNRVGYRFLPKGEPDAEVSITYRKLASSAESISAGLRTLGVGVGDRVILFAPTGLDFVESFYGILYAGAAAVPMSPPTVSRPLLQAEVILRDAQAKLAIAPQALMAKLSKAKARSPLFAGLRIFTREQLQDIGAQALAVSATITTPRAASLALIQYSSGSTSTPKGVQITHDNLLYNASLAEQLMGPDSSGSSVSWLPLYHDMGLMAGVVQPLFTGYPVTLIPPAVFLARPVTWLRAITHYRATYSGGPNFAYELCCDRVGTDQLSGIELGNWKVAFCGAEPIRAVTLERFGAHFKPCGFDSASLFPCYGLAEATLLVSGGPKNVPPKVLAVSRHALEHEQRAIAPDVDEPARRLVSSGEPAAELKVAVVNPRTAERCQNGEVGEVWLHGRSVSIGYWNRPRENERIFNAYLVDSGEGPFLRTGDLGFLQDGQLFVTGRLKDLIIIRGVNHYPHDIEFTVERSHPALRRRAGAAVTTTAGGCERLLVIQEVDRSWRADVTPALDAIVRDVASCHGVRPHVVVLTRQGSVSMTTSGKVRRAATKSAYLAGELNVIAEWTGTEAPVSLRSGREGGHSNRLLHLFHRAVGKLWHVPTPPSVRSETRAGAEALAFLREEVGNILNLPSGDIDPSCTLAEMGMDSLSVVELRAAIELESGPGFGDALEQTEVWSLPLSKLGDKLAASGFGSTPSQNVVPVKNPAAASPSQTLASSSNEELRERLTLVEKSTSAPAAVEMRPLFEDRPAYLQIHQTLTWIADAGVQNPYFRQHAGVSANRAIVGGRDCIHYSGYNYLGLAGHPDVTAAAKSAIDFYGTSVSASRTVSGEIPLHRELESEIAAMLGVEDCMVFNSGYGTNVSTIGHLCGPNDLIVHDALIHNSMMTGSLLATSHRLSFPHNDWQALDQLLALHRKRYERALILVEGVYSMDGDIADLPMLLEVKRRHGCALMVDEAHSLGILGSRGFGIGEHFAIDPTQVDLWMGTLSKSLASCGGYIAGGARLIEYLKYTTPGFVYSAGMTPPDTAAALAAARVLRAEPQRAATARSRAALFLELANERGLDTGTSGGTAIVPIILGDSMNALMLADALFKEGINVHPIIHPAVEHEAARLRFFVSALHTEDEIRKTVDAIAFYLPRHLDMPSPRFA